MEPGSTVIFAQQQFGGPKCRNGSFMSFWAGPADVGFAPESDWNSDLPKQIA